MDQTKTKGIGDSSSITIPKNYIDYISGETKSVNEYHLSLINEAISNRKLVHLVMTGISLTENLKKGSDLISVTHFINQENYNAQVAGYLEIKKGDQLQMNIGTIEHLLFSALNRK
ncbi:hypothetical protein GC101_27605 [Paenibacillus sp. LMG 31459]|uniref:Uncharacterized protein n=1 Tax=Paenibacillus phytohabitans TaxID=2654978 RepID=A0ABX1YQ00_9BACL|nr:hypothetical protein [Paenibacillus phytohabitans]NOU82634.1 hypothetical protein [Paenibacillus phytohabitans]